MLFKNFDIDMDKVTIDDQIIIRPSYLSQSQWFNFWAFSSEASENESIEKTIQVEVDAIVRNNEQEHEEKLLRQERELKREFNSKVEDVSKLINDKFDEIYNSLDDLKARHDD